MDYSRRDFLKNSAYLTAAASLSGALLNACTPVSDTRTVNGKVSINPTPLFKIDPGFYMQFLEPLGVTEPTIEASWNYSTDNWREDYVRCIADLNPGLIRWGGNFIRYYKWKEGIGPVEKRPWMYNYYWGGKETNRVGTHELVDLCRRTGSSPLINVNFMSDGVKRFWKTEHGDNRMGTLKEAAEWVSYCNDPDNKERKANGAQKAFNVKHWQIGNETSYSSSNFSLDEAIKHTRSFAKAMKKRDPSIKLIAWGDASDNGKFRKEWHTEDNALWAKRMIPEVGENLEYIAMHMMGIYPSDKNTVLRGYEYQYNPEKAWNELLDLGNIAAFRLKIIRELLKSLNSDIKVAITEGHLSLSPYNTNVILNEWLSAAYHAKTMNTYLRNADMVGICTGADFSGTRWTVNAARIPVPWGDTFLLPIGCIMRLYKKYGGDQGIQITGAPSDMDIAGTRKGNKIFLHALNTNYHDAIDVEIHIEGEKIKRGKVYEIAPESPRAYVDISTPRTFDPMLKDLDFENSKSHRFPPASVSVVELELA